MRITGTKIRPHDKSCGLSSGILWEGGLAGDATCYSSDFTAADTDVLKLSVRKAGQFIVGAI